tara:strand:+ start:24238 stop:25491 length:1254 start_codon:yes stop_codon:yes gene_type:complete
MELVRISTAGSVDDGKSTLIGRLLYDNDALTKEQEDLVRKKTKEKGWDDLDLSVITDGLVAEREQGITIDVANIYFSTETRKFIIADSPGHVEYTRNMVTGASMAQTSIILVDARKGLLEQSFRHFYISQLLRLENVIFCVNKMDLVEYSEDTFLEISIQIQNMVEALDAEINYRIVPVSSLKGDNVVKKSANMPWYSRETLNQLLHAEKTKKTEKLPFRFDVQQVNHSQENGFVDYRGLAGRVVSGEVSVGDRIVIRQGHGSSNLESIVTEIRRFTESIDTAQAGDSVSISIADEIDISRGGVLSSMENLVEAQSSISTTVVWMDESAGQLGAKYLLKVGSREFPIKVEAIHSKVDPTKANQSFDVNTIEINDISKVDLRLSQSGYFDSYLDNKNNGAFILIDLQSNNTVAVGFVD